MTRTKRISAPVGWQLAKKEKKYVTSISAGPHDRSALPLGVWLRDHLHVAGNAKEARKILHDRQVLVNGHVATDDHLGIDTFDVITFPKINKNYVVLVDQKGRQTEQEISEEAAKVRLVKVANKTTIKGNKTQINLLDGANFVSDFPCKSKDTLIIGIIGNDRFSVKEHFPYAIGNQAIIIGGQHTMKVGKITEIKIQASPLPNRVTIETKTGETVETIEDYVFVIGTTESYLKKWGVDA
ncbi:MAG TPA: 30S ribosomal protein S4e [Methanocorpusculum sp.]|nr:30S ribosomal protein S4e [Methanocorpusculum sp.]